MHDALPAGAIDRLLRPRSVAVVGASPEPQSVSARLLANLRAFGYGGDLHLVSRSRTELDGRPCQPSIDDLPAGIDAAVLNVPQAAVQASIEACARRGIGAAVVFASGFAELGDEGSALQQAIAEVARANGIALLGPNCMGLINAVDGAALTFGPFLPGPALQGPRVAVVAQSGAMMGNVRQAMLGKGLRVSFAVSTGNEAVVGIEDLLPPLVDAPEVDALAVFVETLRRPQAFLAVAARARAAGKPIVLLHPGRGERAQAAAASHTGALAGDHAVMRALVAREGVVLVDTLDELFDTVALLARYPQPPRGDAGVVSNSGALRGLSLDLAESLALPLGTLAPASADRLAGVLPPFVHPDNPLDMTTAGMQNPAVFGQVAAAMLDDPNVGSLTMALMGGLGRDQQRKGEVLLPVFGATDKPVAFVIMGDDDPLDDTFRQAMLGSAVPFFRSPDRALRAMAQVHRRAALLREAGRRAVPADVGELPLPATPGPLAEHKGKQVLRSLGIAVPQGRLAVSVDDALQAAEAIGWPVVLKAQADALLHKSDVGGVVAGVTDAARLRAAWDRLQADVARGAPGLVLEGVLVEAMAPPGLELVLGARRDPQWGPVLMVGLGGIWIEALQDVLLLAPDLDEAQIADALRRLKGARLLSGLRGRPAVDTGAVAHAARRLADLMQAQPRLREIDLNPFVAYGDGGVALDALLVLD
ncbi:acetate--CoA ligase family protein [Aquabacterium sp. J223]|uniref:acetate--CoA ligase family protein n=1 Tax=Aquabacterium sp. J223 TaxID=2898431 RepID=UPI0021AD7C6B|nr:acetate--CoA ligase family protein [Aquabacterium sp. J223]UUX94532.1 acetate--CoA ligase family protein [Aquabacterium sp. J223]